MNEDFVPMPTGVDRRKALKTLGAGGAVAWAAPSVMGLGRAMADTSGVPPCADTCTDCFTNDVSEQCGPTPDNSCLCSITTEGVCFCAANQFGSGPCVDSSTCLPDERCMVFAANNCSDPGCLPACDTLTRRSTASERRTALAGRPGDPA